MHGNNFPVHLFFYLKRGEDMDFLDLAKNFGVPSACCIGLMYYLFNVKLKEDREDRLNERTKDREDMKELYKQMGIMNVTNTKLVETNKSLVECNKKIVDTNQILADKDRKSTRLNSSHA